MRVVERTATSTGGCALRCCGIAMTPLPRPAVPQPWKILEEKIPWQTPPVPMELRAVSDFTALKSRDFNVLRQH